MHLTSQSRQFVCCCICKNQGQFGLASQASPFLIHLPASCSARCPVPNTQLCHCDGCKFADLDVRAALLLAPVCRTVHESCANLSAPEFLLLPTSALLPAMLLLIMVHPDLCIYSSSASMPLQPPGLLLQTHANYDRFFLPTCIYLGVLPNNEKAMIFLPLPCLSSSTTLAATSGKTSSVRFVRSGTTSSHVC